MGKRLELETQEEELLRLARHRVEFPPVDLRLKYQADVDVLLVELTENPTPTNSKDDIEHGLIFNYEAQKLVSIEILDLYGDCAS
jgi:hypothetical protein